MSDIEKCRTAENGGHLHYCGVCRRHHVYYHSCGNRHCPVCQRKAALRWLEKLSAQLLPVPYFHLVFTLPPSVAQMVFQNRKTMFSILFRTVAETIRVIAADRRHSGIRAGGTSVLHTWNQKLMWHPHLHCVVPNAGFDAETGEWKVGDARFFAPAKVLGSYFRRRFLQETKKAYDNGELEFHGSLAGLNDPKTFARRIRKARKVSWNVYAKRPFAGPQNVFKYLSHYTHRIAISDARITAFDGDNVTFSYRKPAAKAGDKPRYGRITLTAEEFLRRFLLHALPSGFHRIRHFGIFANGIRAKTLKAAHQALGIEAPPVTAADGAGEDDADGEETPPPGAVLCPTCGAPMPIVLDLGRRPVHPFIRLIVERLVRRGRDPP